MHRPTDRLAGATKKQIYSPSKKNTTMFANLYNQQLAACNSLHELNIYLLPKDIENITWNTRKSCFYTVSNYEIDVVGTYFAQYEGRPMEPVPHLSCLEDMQDDRRIALFLFPDVLMFALELIPWYDFENGDDDVLHTFIDDLRTRLLEAKCLECVDDEEDFYGEYAA